MKGGGGGGTIRVISRGSWGMLQKCFEIFCAMRELLMQSEALMQG